ncbi:MAG: hypothetical protein JXQ27_11110 [Acidobacteria bacterium]|nr:hypothetical protein [Acidobacteriota bacterium]
MIKTMICFLCLALAAADSGWSVVSAQVEGVLYVDDDAPAGGDGSSWAQALPFLQDALALAAAPGSGIKEIRVARGMYRPDRDGMNPGGTGLRSATFALVSGVAVRGGYAGVTGVFPDTRDPDRYATFFSGDLLGDDLPGWNHYADNAYHVLHAVDTAPGTRLEGVVVRGGYADASSGLAAVGGGMLVEGSSLALDRCVFQYNFARYGGAAYLVLATVEIGDCLFQYNQAQLGRGGALYIGEGVQPAVSGCRFESNEAFGGSGVGDGGAIFVQQIPAMTLTDCHFQANRSHTSGVFDATGGAVSSLAGYLQIDGGWFGDNLADQGGALWLNGAVDIYNTVISGNVGNTFGGGILVFGGPVRVTGVTVTGCHSSDGGGISVGLSGAVAVASSILWGNTGEQDRVFSNQIHNNGGVVALQYSTIEGLFTPAPGEDPPDPADFPGCIDRDPQLVSPAGADGLPGTADDNLRLRPASPAIDAGNNTEFLLPAALDAAGNPRFLDDPATPDSGVGMPPLADMGAYEYQGALVIPGDLDGDGQLSATDLLILSEILAEVWPVPPLSAEYMDISLDGRLDVLDRLLLQRMLVGL